MHLGFPKRNYRLILLLVSFSAMILFILFAGRSGSFSGGTLRALTQWSDGGGTYPLPHENPKVPGESYRVSTVLPSTAEGDCLIFRTENLAVEVLLGQETLYDTATPALHRTVGDKWNFIALPADAAGQTLTIVSTVLFSNGSNFISAAYLGQKADFIQLLFRRQFPLFMVSALLFLLGVALLLGGVLLTKRYLREYIPMSFAVLAVVLGVWTSTQTAIPELLWGSTRILLFCTYGLLPLATMATSFFLHTLPAPRWLKTTYLWFGRAQIVLWAFAVAGETFRFAAYMETLPYTRSMMAVLLALFLFQLPGLIRTQREHFYLLVGLSCLAVMIIVDLANVHAGVYDYANNTRFGILLMTMLIAIQLMVRVRNSIRVADETDLMRRLAYRDTLTGLGNRLALVRDQEALISGKNGCVGIVQMDINDLKPINDQFGHEEGDDLILRAARAISTAFDDLGNSYRIGGDEFVSLLTHNVCETTSEACAERLAGACDAQNQDRRHPLSIAMGYAVYDPASSERFYDLVRTADMRMYEKKRVMKALRSTAAPTAAGSPTDAV